MPLCCLLLSWASVELSTLRLVAIDAHLHLAAFFKPRAEHPRSIEAPRKLSIRSNRNDSTVPVQRLELFVNDLIDSVLELQALELHQVADLARDAEPDEVLSCAGARNCTRLIRGIGARADNRRVTNAPRHLGLHAAR